MKSDRNIENEREVADSFERFVEMASHIADSSLGTRSGFGALRSFQSISDDSTRLVIDSGFLVPPRDRGGEPWF
jgi:hypothetical protein